MKVSDIENPLRVGGIYRPKQSSDNPLGCKYRILVMDEREVLYDHFFPEAGWAISDHLKATCNFHRMNASEFALRYGNNGVMNLTDLESEVIRPDLPVTVEVGHSAACSDNDIALGTPRLLVEFYPPRCRRATLLSITSSDPRGITHAEALRRIEGSPEINRTGSRLHMARLRRKGIRRMLPLYELEEVKWSTDSPVS